jgi:hypothetical protein
MSMSPLHFRRSLHDRAAVEYGLHVEVLADEPLTDASVRDNAVMVGSLLAWAT